MGISLDGFEVEFETIGAENMAKEEELFEEGLGFFGGVRGERKCRIYTVDGNGKL